MYSFMHQHPRLRTTYDPSGGRFNPYQSSGGDSDRSAMASSTKTDSSAPRKNRYARSSTISVTQMLTDSCSSLLQRLTTRVRGPSQTATTEHHHHHQPSTSSTAPLTATSQVESSFLGSTRSRLEDKYSAVLEKLAGKRRDAERTLEPSVSKTVEKRSANPLMKSATTAIVSEKTYPYSSVTQREKTPYRTSAHRLSQHHSYYPEPSYAYLDHYNVYSVRQKPSSVNELRPKRSSRPLRTGKSEKLETEKPVRNNFKLCPVEIPTHALEDKDVTPTNEEFVDPQIAEREARRKEIQSLIMKYSALDEAYNKATSSSAITAISQPVRQAPQPPPHAVKLAHKYQPSGLALTVSRFVALKVALD